MVAILLVEDDLQINSLLVEALNLDGFQVTPAYSGTEAQLLIQHSHFDLILLDLMLPGLSGEELLHQIRSQQTTPIIVLSAKSQIDQKVEVLQAGADDYLVKPFDLKELKARIQICLKHACKNGHLDKDDQDLSFEGLVYHTDLQTITYQEIEISLTPQERRILQLLLQDPQKIYSKLEIYDFAWGGTYLAEDKTLTVHMSNLRKKLKEATGRTWIETIWGIGFRLIQRDK